MTVIPLGAIFGVVAILLMLGLDELRQRRNLRRLYERIRLDKQDAKRDADGGS